MKELIIYNPYNQFLRDLETGYFAQVPDYWEKLVGRMNDWYYGITRKEYDIIRNDEVNRHKPIATIDSLSKERYQLLEMIVESTWQMVQYELSKQK